MTWVPARIRADGGQRALFFFFVERTNRSIVSMFWVNSRVSTPFSCINRSKKCIVVGVNCPGNMPLATELKSFGLSLKIFGVQAYVRRHMVVDISSRQ